MHDESHQAELIKRRREAIKAYSASHAMSEETESQIEMPVEAVTFVPKPDPNEPPPLSRADRIWGQGFWSGFVAGVATLLLTCGLAYAAVKAIDAGAFWGGKLLGEI